MSSDRAAVAREVLTEFTEYFSENFASTVTHRDLVAKFTAERYPAPPAPETVTVNGVQYTRLEGDRAYGKWQSRDYGIFHGPENVLLNRIASDARVLAERDARIAELEKENQTLRDANGNLKTGNHNDWVRWNKVRGALEDAAQERESLIARLDANCVTLQSERDAALRALDVLRVPLNDAMEYEGRLDASLYLSVDALNVLRRALAQEAGDAK